MRTANLKVFSRDGKPIGEVGITDEQVRNAIERYDREYPLNDYPRTAERPHIKTWFEHKKSKFAIRYKGKCYPPKPILRLAIETKPEEGYRFFGGGGRGRANWVLEELGFRITLKSECEQGVPVQMVDEAELVSLRRQLAEARDNLRLIRERKSQYVMETDIPLQVIKDERRLLGLIEELEQCLQAMQH